MMFYLYSVYFALRHLLRVLSPAAVLLLLAFWSHGSAAQTISSQQPPPEFHVLCYHDVRDRLRESMAQWPERTALDTQDLVRHFSWLQENGYQPVSLQQIIEARAGRTPLPDKAVLLTFDDGYKSVYSTVFPLLKQFNYPALVAIVGEWIETPRDVPLQFGRQVVPRAQFVEWHELQEMVASGLVEIASHSHSLHRGLIANPQGNEIPAAIARRFRPDLQQYESDAEYAARIQADLRRNAELIERRVKQRPRAMVWPYGAYNRHVADWAAQAGMPVGLTLDEGANTPNVPLQQLRRSLITYRTGLAELATLLGTYGNAPQQRAPQRIVHVDLDYVYDSDAAKQEENLSQLLDRMQRLRPTTVYLQAYADPDGDGVADALYFPNRHLPLRADLFSRVAWQLRTRTNVKVYAWMPVMAYKLPASHPAADKVVQVMPGAPEAASQGRYHRLSIFDPLVRSTILDIYDDLGKHAVFAGVLFHDDATFSDYEDASPAAIAFYQAQWHLPASLQAIRDNPALRRTWTERKTAYLDEFTLTLAAQLRAYHPALLTARNLYAQPVLMPESQDWYAQDFARFVQQYDFTALMAMPYMEGAADPNQWLKQLIDTVKATPGALQRTVFELQSQDWKNKQAVRAETLVQQIRLLQLEGARHVGYYPDDFVRNQPDEAIIKSVISTETMPQ